MKTFFAGTFSHAVALMLAVWPLSSTANQFVDDYGQVHVLFQSPKIVASAHTAAAFLHLGKLVYFELFT